MKINVIGISALMLALGSVLPPGAIAATPTPMPGGANQIKGVTGTLSSTIFNGTLRFKKWDLRKSTPDEQTPDAGGLALTLTYVVLNGTSKNQYGGVSASMVDADGVVINGRPKGVYGAYFSTEPGAGARGTLLFSLPAGFVPVKILVVPPTGVAIRLNLKPSDLPTPTPVATPSPSPAPSP
jgi:hypothetical protein